VELYYKKTVNSVDIMVFVVLIARWASPGLQVVLLLLLSLLLLLFTTDSDADRRFANLPFSPSILYDPALVLMAF